MPGGLASTTASIPETAENGRPSTAATHEWYARPDAAPDQEGRPTAGTKPFSQTKKPGKGRPMRATAS